jgi:hypothetical protein
MHELLKERRQHMQTEIAQNGFHWQSSSNIYLEKINEIDKRLSGKPPRDSSP